MSLRGRLKQSLQYQQFKVRDPHAQEIPVSRVIIKYRYPIKRLKIAQYYDSTDRNYIKS